MKLFKRRKVDKFSKYHSEYWYFAMLLMCNISIASYIGYEVYKIVNAFGLSRIVDTRDIVITSALYIMIGVAVYFPVSIINYLLEKYKLRKGQMVLIFIELFIMMTTMLKLLFVILK